MKYIQRTNEGFDHKIGGGGVTPHINHITYVPGIHVSRVRTRYIYQQSGTYSKIFAGPIHELVINILEE